MSNLNKEASRIPELDGIRGLAILLVLGHHILPLASYLTQNSFLKSIGAASEIGWVGVDIFFVLSGFLITGILLRSRNEPHYFKNFYARRSLRIFPLYYLVVGALLIFLPQLEKDNPAYTQSFWPVFMLYQQNWLYLITPTPSQWPAHTWSLAIEEQFYMVWPAIVYWLKRPQLLTFSIGVIIFSLFLRVILILLNVKAFGFPTSGFFYLGTVTRFEGLALGAAIALVFESAPIWSDRIKKYAGMSIFISFGLFLAIALSTPDPRENSVLLQTIGYSLLALGTGSLIVLVTTLPLQHWLRVIFRMPVMTFFGKYSYAMYLLHSPFITLLIGYMLKTHRRSGQMWLLYIVLSFAGTVALSLLSWHLLEKHMLKLKHYFD